eukprot:Pgem_evm1s7149
MSSKNGKPVNFIQTSPTSVQKNSQRKKYKRNSDPSVRINASTLKTNSFNNYEVNVILKPRQVNPCLKLTIQAGESQNAALIRSHSYNDIKVTK